MKTYECLKVTTVAYKRTYTANSLRLLSSLSVDNEVSLAMNLQINCRYKKADMPMSSEPDYLIWQ